MVEKMIKTFRGLLSSNEQDRIRLQTIKGKVGYRIVKFEIIDAAPGTLNTENVVKIYKEFQTTIDGAVNFTESGLLGVAFWVFNSSNPQYSTTEAVIFDSEIFNQDIYITNLDVSANANKCNYYIELEVIPLDDAGAEYTTLKDMRST
jgi:hypothetical protein